MYQGLQSDTITVGALSVRFLVEASESNGTVTVFECVVPPRAAMPAPHSHDEFEETIYGLQGTSTWTIDGETAVIGPGDAVCVPRGAVHGFANHGALEARFLAIASPGVFGSAYFHEVADVLATGTPDRAALAAVMRRHGLTPAPGGMT
jgi:quercetin dioxygenase-like cupin family protein